MKQLLAERAKLLAYVVGVLAGLVALGLFHGTVLQVVEGVLVLLTGGGIHQVTNADSKRDEPMV